MRREFADCKFQNIVIDEADEAKFLERPYELAPGNDAPLHIAHTQQAFEIIDLPG